jgi:hypothetical protein
MKVLGPHHVSLILAQSGAPEGSDAIRRLQEAMTEFYRAFSFASSVAAEVTRSGLVLLDMDGLTGGVEAYFASVGVPIHKTMAAVGAEGTWDPKETQDELAKAHRTINLRNKRLRDEIQGLANEPDDADDDDDEEDMEPDRLPVLMTIEHRTGSITIPSLIEVEPGERETLEEDPTNEQSLSEVQEDLAENQDMVVAAYGLVIGPSEYLTVTRIEPIANLIRGSVAQEDVLPNMDVDQRNRIVRLLRDLCMFVSDTEDLDLHGLYDILFPPIVGSLHDGVRQALEADGPITNADLVAMHRVILFRAAAGNDRVIDFVRSMTRQTLREGLYGQDPQPSSPSEEPSPEGP